MTDPIVATATLDDVPAIRALQHRVETALGGRDLMSDAEVLEDVDRALADGGGALVVHRRAAASDDTTADAAVNSDALVGAAWWWRTTSSWLVDPREPDDEVHRLLLDWLERSGVGTVDADASDTRAVDALVARGWTLAHTSFDLEMVGDAPAAIPPPAWPHGVTARGWQEGDGEAVHDLIYRRASWASVPGHSERDLEEWRSLFAGPFLVPDLQVLAVDEDGRLVGAAITRIWDDGTGWVSQLAVDRAHRGSGVGRALLRAGLIGLRDHGATSLGLSVNSDNRGALGLYLDTGLRVVREYATYAVGVS